MDRPWRGVLGQSVDFINADGCPEKVTDTFSARRKMDTSLRWHDGEDRKW
jgi:hypothetical protein